MPAYEVEVEVTAYLTVVAASTEEAEQKAKAAVLNLKFDVPGVDSVSVDTVDVLDAEEA